MVLLINTASTYDGGAIQVALSFIQECKKIHSHQFHVILGIKISTYINQVDYPNNFKFYTISFRPAERIFSLKSKNNFFSKIENEVKPDVVFTTSGPAYWKPNAPHLCGFNIPQSVYRESHFFDLLPFNKQIKWKIDRYVRRYFFKKEAKDFVVQTDDINSRLRFWFNTEKVYTVSNTCHAYYHNPPQFPDKLPKRVEGEFRFLTFSTYRPHKNFILLKTVIDRLPESLLARVRFIITIPQTDFEAFFEEKYRKNVINIGPVKVNEGASLYKECDAAFIPTLLECFSATYPEAMAMKLPIMSSDLSFARSICQNAADYFDPYDSDDVVNKMEVFISSEEFRNQLIKNGELRLIDFGTGEDRAYAFIQLCETILKKNKK
jgi:glycosyltransferase involved in cell wall biosynthesis